MRLSTRALILVASLLSFTQLTHAASAADPSGHWEGTLSLPNGDVAIEIDIAKDAKGKLAGAFSKPDENLKGLAFNTVSVQDGGILLDLNIAGGGRFEGTILDGGKIAGEFSPSGFVMTLPFNLVRKGEAHLEGPPKSPAISKELEGVWKGAITVDSGELPIILTLSNQPDGTSTGTMNSVNENLEVPVTIVQKGANLTLEVKATGGIYSGTLNAAGTELAGSYTSHGMGLPLNFRRESK